MSDRAKGDVLRGQQFNPTEPAVIPYTQQDMPKEDADALVGTDGTEINPKNKDISEVKQFDIAATQALLDAVHVSMPSYVTVSSLDLPDQLVSVTVTSNKNHGDGASSHPSSQQGFAVTGSGSGSLNPRASASGSAAVLFDIQPVIKQFNRGKIQGTRYFFYMADNSTWAQVLTRLTTLAGATVLALPVFKPVAHVVTLKGQSVAVSVSADTTVSASDSASSASASWDYGSGYNESVELSMKTVEIPPTIHALITFSSTSDTDTATVSADASSQAISGTVVSIGAFTNTIGPRTKVATATITPTSLAATTPTAIPTSGLYVVDIDRQPYAFDRIVIFAEVVDFAYFA